MARSFLIALALIGGTSSSAFAADGLSLLQGALAVRQSMGPGAARIDLSYRSSTTTNKRSFDVTFEGARRRFLATGGTGQDKAFFDGRDVVHFNGESVTFFDPTASTAVYLFDPRALGATSFYSVGESLENSLGLENAKQITLDGVETLDGRALHRVRVLDTWDQERWFWMEGAPLFRIYRTTFKVGDSSRRTESKYDGTAVLPREVHTVGERNGLFDFERIIRMSPVKLRGPAPTSEWSLAALDLPLGTPVSDLRIKERLGYWDGKQLSVNPPAAVSAPGRHFSNGIPWAPLAGVAICAMAAGFIWSRMARFGGSWVVRKGPPQLGSRLQKLKESHVVLIAEVNDRGLLVQDFILNGESYEYMFSSKELFDTQMRGSPFEDKCVSISLRLFSTMLHGSEKLMLDPGGPSPLVLTAADIKSLYGAETDH